MPTPGASPPPLFKHQQSLYDQTRDAAAWGVLFEQGLGKTAPTIRTAEHLFQRDQIDGVVVVAPNGVHRNWISDELPAHAGVPWRGLDWHSDRGKGQDRALDRLTGPSSGAKELAWLAITYEGMITPRGRAALIAFAVGDLDAKGRRVPMGRKPRYPRCMLVIDEGSKVRNPESQRTKKVAALRAFTPYVRLLNGTPIGNSALDVYAQMKLLDPQFWIRHGIGSWTAFQAQFAVVRKIQVGGDDDSEVGGGRRRWEPIVPHDADPDGIAAYEQLDLSGILDAEVTDAPVARPPARVTASPTNTKTSGRTIEIVVGFRELDKLKEMIAPITTRLTKEDAGVELPPKLYSRILFDLPTEQRRVYDTLRKEYMVELDSGALITAPLALVRILRLQQIACGYLPDPDDPDNPKLFYDDDGKNARLKLLLERLEDTPHQAIVWARFTHDVDSICRALGPPMCTRYDGQVSQKERDRGIDRFKEGKVKFCVAKAASMGMGLSLPMAKSVFYYSNTEKYIERLQSEDRSHRLVGGGLGAVCYYDLVASRTVDEKILRSLRDCQDVANKITGDRYRSWLEET
jgi:SNF2-related domain/Helicase conserved C-terminal domain